MSSTIFTRPHYRQASACHFYAIVAVSCCALLPITAYTFTEEMAAPQVNQENQVAPNAAEKKAGPEKIEPAQPQQKTQNDEQNDEQKDDQEDTQGDVQPTSEIALEETTGKHSKNVGEVEQNSSKDSVLNFATAGNSLREQAARYRKLAEQWQPVSPGATLRAGDQSQRVAQLRKLLELFGDYHGQPGPVVATSDNQDRYADLYDAGLQLAVESYQRRHGLTVTGIADSVTLKELERSPEELARLLEINAERWDKLPDKPGKRYILVNVPNYQLQLIDQQRVVLSMKTVVGKSSKRTPDMTTKVVSVVFNPTWTVPRSILLTDLLPKARNNPEAMHKRGYRVVKYGTNTTKPISDEGIQSAARGKATLRQISGPGNTLGRVKFVIPNKQAIFLHDTQAQSLFEHRHRAFSHGCIRLQEPEELAYALLGPQGWDRTRVAQATTGDESVTIKVDAPPRLFITYLTAWVDALGKVHFRPDIYHRDKSSVGN
ncbi:L,D-transpeptidase family protein [Microbulbifer elongatus]|uniref:L,D-transpeptidase family protein n=1 Tax=Microbulbifer elongatus TaxID=86173 RepID=UPI001CFD8E0D|nr:L,D-transpeptidase family protein [Microbulbifer elongatus]